MTIRIYELSVLCALLCVLCGKKSTGPRRTQRKIQHKVHQDMIGLLHTDSQVSLFFKGLFIKLNCLLNDAAGRSLILEIIDLYFFIFQHFVLFKKISQF